MAGMLLGFLFGIPRFIARAGIPAALPDSSGQAPGKPPASPAPGDGQQPGQPPTGQASGAGQQQAQAGVNTNLEEISD